MKKTATKSKGRRREPSILLHADNTDPDMWYFGRFNAFDPYNPHFPARWSDQWLFQEPPAESKLLAAKSKFLAAPLKAPASERQ